MRQIRSEEAGAGADRGTGSLAGRGGSGVAAPDVSFGGARSAILSLYAAKIEATRRTLSGQDIAAAVRTLRDERSGALKALAMRKQLALRAGREQRAAERFSDRLANRREVQEAARAPPDARPS